ncbi:MAG TPA: hypothetical protein VHU80_17515 [Polyangiaceae bacterium]|nr:hypothetical protein [Polyangiaceae bacterium]
MKRRHATAPRPAASPGVRRFLRGVLLAGVASLPIAVVACGPDARSVGDSCPDLPLYRYVFDADTKTWIRVQVDSADGGVPLTDAQVSAIRRAEQSCVTKAGNANSITTAGESDAGTD